MRSAIALALLLALISLVAPVETDAATRGGRTKVLCHMPPGNPGNGQTISVGSAAAYTAHLRHGDMPGPCREREGVALLFVGHGEPATAPDGDIPISFPDGDPFGPHAVSLGVPPQSQYTEWAAAYEEIATAMTYIFPDYNGNGIPHEVAVFPDGDVPEFFPWPAFHGSVYGQYQACGGYSAHNDRLREHVESLDIEACGTDVEVYLAYLDAVPRIRDVLWEIATTNASELVVIPMLLADSTHTQEVSDLIDEAAHLTAGMEVVVTEPFFEVPFVQRRFRDAVLGMAHNVRAALPADVADHNIGVLLASHGSPYVPPYPEFGYVEGEIFSNLVPTEDEFHEAIGERLPWMSRTGRMNWSSPTIEQTLQSFEADGFTHVMVILSAFPTPAIHTMFDIANAAVGRPVLPSEGVVSHTRASGMTVYYTSAGIADFEPGRTEFRRGLDFLGKAGVAEALSGAGALDHFTPFEPCPAGQLCVTLSADQLTGGELKYMLYETTEADWPQAYDALPAPDWIVIDPGPLPGSFPARVRIPLEQNLLPVAGQALDGTRFGLAVASTDGPGVDPTDARGFSTLTAVHHGGEGLDFGFLGLVDPTATDVCLPGEICVTLTAQETTGPDLKLMLYETTDADWPYDYLDLPTPSWVVTQTVPVPASFPFHVRIPVAGNLFAVGGQNIDGARLGLAVVTGVASIFIVEPDDARGFSQGTLVYQAGAAMHYGAIDLAVPQGDTCTLNPYNPQCLTGSLLWQMHMIGQPGFVPGAIYLDVEDLDGDGVRDIVMVGEPHFEEPNLPLTELKLGVVYLNADLTIKGTEIIDAWSDVDQTFYSPWGVNVIDHGGEPMILVGTNIPGLAPLEDGSGAVLSYRREAGVWVRSILRENLDPMVTNYNAMIVVTSDIDGDGDEDLALSSAFGSSAVGSWMENTGLAATPWIPHLQTMAPGTDPAIRGVLGYKSADLNGDGYPEVVYNGMFDVPNTNPPQYRGEIWLGVNPGPGGWDGPWQKIVIDDDNWASADMWLHDFDDDGDLDLVANQIFDGTVTVYKHPGSNLDAPWTPVVIIDDLTSPSDMWLADMDGDGLMDVVSADHTAHRGVWHKNPGALDGTLWRMHSIYRETRLPGDFSMVDLDGDGDLDWIGTTLTTGQPFIVEQVQPATSLVATISLPDTFSGQVNKLLVTLASQLPVTGPPAATPVTILNVDADGNGEGDVDEILNGSRDLVLAIPDVGLNGDYHVVVALYMAGGGQFQPLPGVDYMAAGPLQTFGQGQVHVTLDLALVP